MTACLLRDQCIGQSRSDDQRAKRIYYDCMYNVYISIIRIIRIIRLLSIVWCGLLLQVRFVRISTHRHRTGTVWAVQ